MKTKPNLGAIKELKDFNVSAKVAAFDAFYDSARSHFEEQSSPVGYREDSDDAHYVYEQVMTVCLGEGVFDLMISTLEFNRQLQDIEDTLSGLTDRQREALIKKLQKK